MKYILDYNLKELEGMFLSLGFEKFRAKQLYQACLNGKDFHDKINVPANIIEKMQELGYQMQAIKIDKALKSKDKDVKFLYKLKDGNIVEGMLMQYKFGNTICVSTQIGCKMNCAFCASGMNGFARNLSCGEIIGQVVAVNDYLKGNLKDRQITNIVLMGSGEPLDNYDNVLKFLKNVTSEESFNISVRNISLSTCGLTTGIEKLADAKLPITLCLSLHAPNDIVRGEIMPISKRYNIHALLEACNYYYTMTNRRIIIEYILIDQVNSSTKYAKELSTLLKDLPCHVNLIKLNEVKERGLKAPSDETCENFLNNLHRYNISATMRRTIGEDIDGACGQLRNKELDNNKNANPKSFDNSKIATSIREKSKIAKLNNKNISVNEKNKFGKTTSKFGNKTGKFDTKKPFNKTKKKTNKTRTTKKEYNNEFLKNNK